MSGLQTEPEPGLSVALLWLQVVAALVWNVLSIVVGLVGVAYVCWLLTRPPPTTRFCVTDTWGDVVPTEEEQMRCVRRLWILNVSLDLGLIRDSVNR